MPRKFRRALGRSPVERRIRIAVATGVVLYAIGFLLATDGLTVAGLWFGIALVGAGLALGYALGLGRARYAGSTR